MAESVHAEKIKEYLVQRQEKDDDHHEVDAALDSTDSEERSQQKEDQETKIMVKNVTDQHSHDSDNVGSTSKVEKLEAGDINSKKTNKVGLTEQGFKKLNEEVLIKNSKKILYEIDDPIPEMVQLFKDPVLECQGLYYRHKRGRQFQPWNYPNGVYDPIPAFLDHFDINDLSLSELENFWEGLDDLESNDE